jgi:hypothetical protein
MVPWFKATAQGSDIPDSGDLQARYDFSQEDGSLPIADQTGNGYDLTGSYSGVSADINGNQAGSFDGVDDETSATWTSVSEPNHIFAVFEYRGLSPFANNIMISDPSGSEQIYETNAWAMYNGSVVSGGTSDTSPHVGAWLFDGANSSLRIDGTTLATGDPGSTPLEGLRLGSVGGNLYANVKFGEILVYRSDRSGNYSEIESYLADKWGITI